MDTDLFGNSLDESISVVDDGLDISYWAAYLSKNEASNYLTLLLKEITWQQPEMWMFGRLVRTPRLTAWHGDENTTYRYSGIINRPAPWTPLLSRLRHLVETTTDRKFNSVLLNLYRNGSDYLSWHSDDEVELGVEPTIASLSLGASRTFCLRSKSPSTNQKRVDIILGNGSLLCMRGQTQAQWDHSVKKEPKILDPRINLTFRSVNSG